MRGTVSRVNLGRPCHHRTANALHKIQQIDRRGSSCPILFSWNGEKYEFVSDSKIKIG